MSTQAWLILVRSTPYGSHQPRAAIDLALTAAAFEQKVSFVFLDAGVLQLTVTQDTGEAGVKNIGKMIPALKLYDVESVYLHTLSAQQYGLSLALLPEDMKPIDDASLQALLAAADQVMVF